MQPFHLFTSIRVLTPKGTVVQVKVTLKVWDSILFLSVRKQAWRDKIYKNLVKTPAWKVFFLRYNNLQGWLLNDHFPVGRDSNQWLWLMPLLFLWYKNTSTAGLNFSQTSRKGRKKGNKSTWRFLSNLHVNNLSGYYRISRFYSITVSLFFRASGNSTGCP